MPEVLKTLNVRLLTNLTLSNIFNFMRKLLIFGLILTFPNISFSLPIKPLLNLFQKNEINFERCYRQRDRNYDDFVKGSIFKKWDWEINLKEKKAVRIIITNYDNKVQTDAYPIKTITKNYIETFSVRGTSYMFMRNLVKYKFLHQEIMVKNHLL